MKYYIFLFILFAFLSKPAYSQQKENNKLLIGVFDGRTPCQELAKLLEETVPDCTKIKWRLTLYKDSASQTTGTYELIGFMRQKRGPRIGRWHITKGTAANPAAIVYHLEHVTQAPLLLQKADDNLFYFLDKDKKLLVGNRDFSYALNRVNKEP